MKKGIIALLALAFTLAVVVPALAEDPAGPAAQEQKSAAQNMRQEIVKLKYVRAQDIQQVIYPFLGPFGLIRFNDNMPMVLTVSAPAENMEKVLAVIRELDVKPADVLYTVQLVLGSESDTTTDAELQNDSVIKELHKLLRFKGYSAPRCDSCAGSQQGERGGQVLARRPNSSSPCGRMSPGTRKLRSSRPRSG